MLWGKLGHVPHIAINNDPAILWSVVFGDLFDREELCVTHDYKGEDRKRDGDECASYLLLAYANIPLGS